MVNSVLNLSSVNGSYGFVINGINAFDGSGESVSSAGDINGDGFDDLIIGATRADPNGMRDAGESYVVFGSDSRFVPNLNLSSLDGSNGFVINGIDEYDNSGRSVSGAGDINGDGIDDLIIGASNTYPTYVGESYVVFGSISGFSASLNLSSLNGSNGFVINGVDVRDSLGSSVSGAGDINGDGIDDIIIGAISADPNGESRSGSSYVVFGSSSGFSANLNLSSLNGSNGFVINGVDAGDFSGGSVSGAGDVNGDGIDDIIIGAISADPNGQEFAGESYVVFGSRSGFSANLNLSSLNGSNGFVINGVGAGDGSGNSVSNTGDINGDGIDDIIIGAISADPNGESRSGSSYVVFGSSSGFSANLNLSSLNGSNGFVINGVDAGDFSGGSVSGAGDVNGDGIDDIIIGAIGADPNGQEFAGESYVVFGSRSGFSASLNLSSLNGSNGFVINGVDEDDLLGNSVSGAGDINGDGFDDLIIGVTRADPNGQNYAGLSYVVFGFDIPNQPPVAVNDTVTTNKDTAVNISVLANDSDPESDLLIVTRVNGTAVTVDNPITLSSGAILTLNADSTFIYNPNRQFDSLAVGQTATDSFTYNITDGRLANITATVTLTINGVNAAPRLVSVLNLSELNGSNGFVINGEAGQSGRSVSSAGDINGDGIDDLIIGARFAKPNNIRYAGESYVVFGSGNGFAASLNLSSLNGSNGFVINGVDVYDYSGSSVSAAGDINGDGIDDLIIGASRGTPFSQDAAGSSYVVFGSSNGFSASLNLSSLNGSNGFVINGVDDLDYSGSSVSGAGDINGDGIDDLIIGASSASPNGEPAAGSSYVVFGSNSGFAASLNVSSLDGSNGFVINGIDGVDYSGSSVSSAGDINGDGIDDLIIGANRADPNGESEAGSSYVVFGSSNGFSASLNLSSLNGSNGFVINGVDAGDSLGYSVSGAGDINGDGIDDLIIGAAFADPNVQRNAAGESYVVFGSRSGFSANLNLSSLDGSNGFVINGVDAYDRSGNSVSNAGDINGDGIDDLIIGARGADPNRQEDAGESYVVFGSSNGFAASLNLSSLDGSNGFLINGIAADDRSGFSVSGAGDINGDGIDDLIIGAFGVSPNGQYAAGSSYVVFGFTNTATTNEDTAVNILASNILRRYEDAEGDILSISSFTNPANGTLTFNNNSTPDNPNDDFFVYTPNANYNGTDNFTFTVNDGNGGNVT
ncbi:tandem-95 repeat protein, partial [Nostoc sp. CHAB 5844]|nr:tandem-95 repeat protein [Nostoc sp. CHAB 5844]